MGGVRRFFRRFFLTLAALSLIGGRGAVLAVPYRRAATEEKRIALTFDDGPSADKTREILDVLAEYGVKATFFVIGENAWKQSRKIAPLAEIITAKRFGGAT